MTKALHKLLALANTKQEALFVMEVVRLMDSHTAYGGDEIMPASPETRREQVMAALEVFREKL